MKIIIVEDDRKTAGFIEKGLRQYGYDTVHASDGITGSKLIRSGGFDLAVVDVMLPGMDGISLVSDLRRSNADIPVLILSARDTVQDKIKGLEAGADDYLVKPFAFAELLARIQALLRRSASAAAESTVLHYEDLTIDLISHKVSRNGEKIDIQPQEYLLLEYLARNAGQVVSKTMIIENVWEYNFDPQTNIVETRMCRLREKIDKPFERKLIRTVRGFGYVLE